MGKKMKPKGRNPRKPQPRSRVSDPNRNPSDLKPNTEQQEEGETEEGCNHYTKGNSHLNQILLSILSSSDGFSSCDHCRDESSHVNTKRGAKKKNNKKGATVSRGNESKSDLDPMWVCLDCGRTFCGGAVTEAEPYGHSRRHAKQERHNWAVGTNSAGTAWCFICNSEVPIEMPSTEETASSNSTKSNSEPDYKIAKSDSKSESRSESNFQIGNHHVIRGLSNLGNTCFFNSVLQNVLALKTLRETLFPQQNPYLDPNSNSASRVSVTGPLTMSLKKLFVETSLGDEYKGTLSPKNLFGNICAKAPQFRGFQQQDSHELLRYLLDGLHTEEISARKLNQDDSSDSDKTEGSVVDSVFGGLLSSTVSCMDCGYTSVVHEPFLDLSIPVPAKKTNNNVGGRKSGTNRPTVVRGRGRTQRVKQRSGARPSPVEDEKQDASSPKEGKRLKSTVSKEEENMNGLDGVDLKVETEGPAERTVSEADAFSFSWLDYIDPEPTADSEAGLDDAVCEAGVVGLEGAVSEATHDVESDSTDLKEKVRDNDLSDAKSNNTDSVVLKATGNQNISSDAKSEEPDSTDLKAKVHPEYDSSTVLDAKVDGNANISLCASPNESDGMILKAKVDDESESKVLKSKVDDESESTVLDANTKELDSTIFEDESWLLDGNGSGTKSASKPDPLSDSTHKDEKENDSIETMASDMGLSTVMGPDPDPDPNPLSLEREEEAQEEETDFVGFGDMFNEPEEVTSGPVKKPEPKAEEDEDGDSIFWGSGSLHGLGFSQEEVDDTSNPVSVASCLSLFTKTEILTGEHAWHCEKCSELQGSAIVKKAEEKTEKVMRDAVKRFLINKAPQILTVHLKRFSQDARGRLSKLRGHVNFEEILDIKPYFDPRSKEKERFVYRLVGVVEHSGSMSGGHYIAYVRGERVLKGGAHCQTWFYASDAHVKEVSFEQVLKSEAYLLFYERLEN